MKLHDIRMMPTVIANTHESCYRSFQVVNKLQELIEQETPHEVLLEILDDLMKAPQQEMSGVAPGPSGIAGVELKGAS